MCINICVQCVSWSTTHSCVTLHGTYWNDVVVGGEGTLQLRGNPFGSSIYWKSQFSCAAQAVKINKHQCFGHWSAPYDVTGEGKRSEANQSQFNSNPAVCKFDDDRNKLLLLILINSNVKSALALSKFICPLHPVGGIPKSIANGPPYITRFFYFAEIEISKTRSSFFCISPFNVPLIINGYMCKF